MVEMFDDRIEITNFGGLAKGLKPEDFGKKSVLRNPNIANLLHRAGYIEKMGTGINKMKKLISKAGLPPIKFEFDTFFTATFRRPKTVAEAVIKARVKARVKVIDIIKNNPKITTIELAEILGITVKGGEWNLKKLKESGIIERIGPAKGGSWEVAKK
jgi:ATP-dependent DNA helicase RecG